MTPASELLDKKHSLFTSFVNRKTWALMLLHFLNEVLHETSIALSSDSDIKALWPAFPRRTLRQVEEEEQAFNQDTVVSW